MAKAKKSGPAINGISKCPTGILGLDEVTFGGLPRGRPTLVCGGAGCGKTLLGLEFLVRGATQYNEPGVCISFEETGQELSQSISCTCSSGTGKIQATYMGVEALCRGTDGKIVAGVL